MLDIHSPHETVHTWKDFFIHIATIVVGLVIAVGLEQTVEAVHHHDQVIGLTEELHVEANNNLPLIRDSIARLEVQIAYVSALQRALQTGKVSGPNVAVTGVTPPGSSILYVSPSRATWSSAETAGIAALLPAGPAKVYARLDYNAVGEVAAEDFMLQQLQMLTNECLSANYDSSNPATSTITILHRDSLLFRLGSLQNAIQSMIIRLSILEGGDQAVVAGARSLDEMFPYQNAAIAKLHLKGSMSTFYGAGFNEDYTNKPGPAPSNH